MLLATSAPALGAGDATRGANVFRACAACHSLAAGEQLTGPSLAGVWQRKAASAEGFDRYSEALKRSGLVWTADALDKWLADPEALVPGTSMTFPGLRDARSRQDVIAYLEEVDDGKAPVAAQRGGMHGTPSKADLKRAPLEGQVIAISRCRDTFTVTTADGRSNKVWEFNLRFKTDSSALGPRPGKPVIVRAGMQGDRASIVFAAPAEISGFIKESCASS
jgi:cytochrome c